jgi:hypothetical protein
MRFKSFFYELPSFFMKKFRILKGSLFSSLFPSSDVRF